MKLYPVDFYKLPILKIQAIGKELSEVTLDIRNSALRFWPGQYIRVTLPTLSPNVKGGNTRDFSIASSPNNKKELSFSFRHSKSSFKTHLLKAKKGTFLQIQGPLGSFLLPEDKHRPIIFLAGGIGITPMLSMLRFATENKLPHPIQFVFANSKDRDVPYFDELKRLEKENPHLELFSQEGPLKLAPLQKKLEVNAKTLWYLCGPPQMVQELYEDIQHRFNVEPENIMIEEYVGYQKNLSDYKTLSTEHLDSYNSEKVLKENLTQVLLDVVGQSALIAMTDVQGNILYVNDKFAEVSGYKREELLGQNHRILKSGFHPPEFYEDMWATISRGKLWRGEVKNRAKDGSYYWVDTSISPIFNAQGKIDRYMAVRFLITERKDLEESRAAIMNILDDVEHEKERSERLSQELARYKLAVDSANDQIILTDAEGTILYANKALEKLSGYSVEEVLGTKAGTKWGGQMDKSVYQDLWKTIKKEKKAYTGELKNRNKNGEFYDALLSISPMLDRNGEVSFFVGIERDITKEKTVDRMKTEFLSLASHQLRTPLSATRWFCEMLLIGDMGQLTEPQKDVIKDMYESNSHMIELVNTLLNISRIESGRIVIEPEPTQLNKLIQDVLKEIQPQMDAKKQHCEVKVSREIKKTNLDPKLIREVYKNLLTNASKYSPEKGKITVQVEVKGETILSTILDNGYGIPEKDKARIFKKFFRADNIISKQVEGNGLGLYLVKAIVESSGGEIWFESKEKKGTKFFFTLPKRGVVAKKGEVSLNS